MALTGYDYLPLLGSEFRSENSSDIWWTEILLDLGMSPVLKVLLAITRDMDTNFKDQRKVSRIT
jgi:hypothetical protein